MNVSNYCHDLSHGREDEIQHGKMLFEALQLNGV